MQLVVVFKNIKIILDIMLIPEIARALAGAGRTP